MTWRAEIPKTFFSSYQWVLTTDAKAIVTRANEELDAKDAQIAELEARIRELRATLLEERYWNDWIPRKRLSTARLPCRGHLRWRVAKLLKHYASAIRAGRT